MGASLKPAAFKFYAHGHPKVTATHPTTIEITTDNHLTERGDCIVAVGATCGLRNIPPEIKRALSEDGAKGVITIEASGEVFRVEGRGSGSLTFQHSTEIVVRKSDYVSERTLMIEADKAARDIPRSLVRQLRRPDCQVTIEVRTI